MTIVTCGRCLGSGRYSRGTCFTCNGAGKVRKVKLIDVEETMAHFVWPNGSSSGWMSPAVAEREAHKYPGTKLETTTVTVKKRVPI